MIDLGQHMLEQPKEVELPMIPSCKVRRDQIRHTNHTKESTNLVAIRKGSVTTGCRCQSALADQDEKA
jgi:hypothetical protein